VAAVAALAILMVALPGQRAGVTQTEVVSSATVSIPLTYEACLDLKRAGRYQKAAEGLRAVVAADESHVRAHYALAWTLVKLDDFEGARAQFRRVIDLAPESAEATEAEAALARLDV
jgi:Flp pilus assembly protein TadD